MTVKTVKLKNISEYEVVISEIPGGIAFKKGEVKEIDDKYIEIVMQVYAKFLRLAEGK